MPTKKQPSVGFEFGDLVYAHGDSGPRVLKVLASGADGFIGETDDGEQHRVPTDKYLGHKARMKHAYVVSDIGEDGCLLADETGQCRYVAGKPPQAPEGKPARDNANRFARLHTQDLKLDAMGSLSKAFLPLPLPTLPALPSGLALLLKASGESVANRPGLAQRRITDRTGRTSLRWVRAMPEQKKERKHAKPDEADPRTPHKDDKPVPPALHKHGDTVAFRHGDVEGTGKIVGSGADGVTVQTEDGREHMIRHDAILPDHPASDKDPEQAKADALDLWRGNGFKDINNHLRDGTAAAGAGEMEEAHGVEMSVKDAIKLLDAEIDNSETPTDLTTQRAITGPQADGIMRAAVGKVIKDKGYQSVTAGDSVQDFHSSTGLTVVLKAPLPAGSPALRITEEDNPADLKQDEYLLPRGSAFKVTSKPTITRDGDKVTATITGEWVLGKTDKPDKVAPKSARKPKGKTAP